LPGSRGVLALGGRVSQSIFPKCRQVLSVADSCDATRRLQMGQTETLSAPTRTSAAVHGDAKAVSLLPAYFPTDASMVAVVAKLL
jgi:hypothetical protein